MIQFDEHIFQMGWFNHQPVNRDFPTIIRFKLGDHFLSTIPRTPSFWPGMMPWKKDLLNESEFQGECHNLELQGPPVYCMDGCLVISNHFLYKDLVKIIQLIANYL